MFESNSSLPNYYLTTSSLSRPSGGSGSLSSVLAGMDWIAAHHKAKTPASTLTVTPSSSSSTATRASSVVNLSLGTQYSSAMNAATAALGSLNGKFICFCNFCRLHTAQLTVVFFTYWVSVISPFD